MIKFSLAITDYSIFQTIRKAKFERYLRVRISKIKEKDLLKRPFSPSYFLFWNSPEPASASRFPSSIIRFPLWITLSNENSD